MKLQTVADVANSHSLLYIVCFHQKAFRRWQSVQPSKTPGHECSLSLERPASCHNSLLQERKDKGKNKDKDNRDMKSKRRQRG
jgi:hypothetical protein